MSEIPTQKAQFLSNLLFIRLKAVSICNSRHYCICISHPKLALYIIGFNLGRTFQQPISCLENIQYTCNDTGHLFI